FFFQAEDGIRDRNVTGVQTCALPILQGRSGALRVGAWMTRAVARVMDARDGRDGDDACYACPVSAGGTYRPFPMLDRRRRPRARCRHRAPAMVRLGLRTDGPDVGHAGPADPLSGTRGRRPAGHSAAKEQWP